MDSKINQKMDEKPRKLRIHLTKIKKKKGGKIFVYTHDTPQSS